MAIHRIFTTFFALTGLWYSIPAQQVVLDSVESYRLQVDYFKSRNLDSVLYYLDRLDILSQDTENNKSEFLKRQLVRAELMNRFNQPKKADSILNMISIDDNNHELMVKWKAYKGRSLNKLAKREEALSKLYEGLELAKAKERDDWIIEIYYYIAETILMNDDYDESTRLLRSVIKNGDITKNGYVMIQACIEMCIIHNGWMTVDLDTAVYYGRKGIDLAQEAGDQQGYYQAVSMVAAPVIRLGQLREGIDLSKKAYRQAERFNFSEFTRYSLIANQGFAFETLEVYDSALFYMKKAQEIRPGAGDFLRLKYRIFKSQGQLDSALLYYEKYHQQITESLRARSKTRLSDLQSRNEVRIKEAEIKSLSQQAEIQALQIRQRNQAIGIGIALFILAIVILYFLNAQRNAKKQRKQIELEQRFLRSQLNPHFISNALVAVQSSLLEKDIESAENYLTTFSRLMREMLENSRAEQIPIEDEVSMLQDFLTINKKRLKSGFDFSIKVADEIDQEFDTIPPMLIQPFVENAIEHGIAPKDENLVVAISFHKEESGIRVIVKDNGGGLKEAKVNSSKESLSTQIIKERLALFNQSLKEKMSLSIDNWKDEKQGRIGLEVTLTIPQG